jgi:hypothetical protein
MHSSFATRMPMIAKLKIRTDTCSDTYRLCDNECRPAGKSSGAYRLALPCDEAHRAASTDVIENRPEISTEHRGSTEYVFGSLYRLPHFPHRDSPRA